MAYGNSDAGTTFTILADYHDNRMQLMQRDSVDWTVESLNEDMLM
jgi:hypothetical protein